MRPTCLDADKKLSTETNLQRSRRPASEHDFLRTTNKNCFSCDIPVSHSVKLKSFTPHVTFLATFGSAVLCHGFIIMNPSYPFYLNIDPDQTTQDRYRPGQLFWRRNHSENNLQFAENTFPTTSTVLAPFQPQLQDFQPMSIQASLAAFMLRT